MQAFVYPTKAYAMTPINQLGQPAGANDIFSVWDWIKLMSLQKYLLKLACTTYTLTYHVLTVPLSVPRDLVPSTHHKQLIPHLHQ